MIAALAAAALIGLAPAPRPCVGAMPPARYAHVIWIWMENKPYDAIVGNLQDAPYENRLAGQCALATDYHAIAHPSLPNYIAATSGDTWGVGDDGPPTDHRLSAVSVFEQAATWRAYEESSPGNCPDDSHGDYARKHDPALYYVRIHDECLRWDVPFTRFAGDLRSGRLPQFAFVTPNLCNDTHDCDVSTGDAWLARVLPPIFASETYRAGGTAVFLVWDEGSHGGDNQVALLAMARSIRPGTRAGARFDHYSLLRTTEELLGLPLLARARWAPSMAQGLRLRGTP